MAIDAQADEAAFSKQYDAEQAQKAQQAASAKTDQQPSLLERFAAPVARVTTSMLDSAVSEAEQWGTAAKRVGQDAAAGTITGATNIADAAHSGLESAARHIKLYPGDPGADPNAPEPLGPIWAHAKSAILDFRDAIAVKDPNVVDNLTQGVAQLAVPFAGFSRALSSLHGVANVVAAGAATDATALAPHDMRMADVLAMGRHTEGKLGEVLRTLAPDGSALNGYINFLTDRGNETEAEGRFKNVLDGFGVNLIATPLIHAAAVALKQGTAGVRYAIDNGIGSTGELVPPGEAPLQQPAGNRAELQKQYETLRKQAEELHAQPHDLSDPAFIQKADELHRKLIDTSDQFRKLPPAETSLEADSAVSFARSHAEAQNAAGREGSVHDVVTALSKHMSGDSAEGDFYKDLFQRLSSKNLDGHIVPPGSGAQPKARSGTAGYYVDSENTIALHPGAFESNGRFAHTLAHEAVHMATWNALKSDPAARQALTSVIEEARSSEAFAKLKSQDKYGLRDGKPTEVVAEAESNPRFQQFLKNAKAQDGRPLWDHYKEAIGGIFGLTGVAVASPYFDKVLTREKSGG